MGASGAQGAAVIDALLREGRFSVRATAHDASSPDSLNLHLRGVEVVQADTANKESLVEAFRGCFAVFGLISLDAGFEEGKNVVDAAKEAVVDHFIFSSLPNCEKLSGGLHKVPRFTAKGQVEEYARAAGLQHAYFLQSAAYFQNFQTFWAPKKDESGVLTFRLALKQTCPLAMCDVNDMGTAVCALLRDPKQFEGQTIPLCGANLTLAKICMIFADATGVAAKFEHVPSALVAVESPESAELFDWINDYGYFGPSGDVDAGHKLCRMTSFNDWLRSSGWKGEQLPHEPTKPARAQQRLHGKEQHGQPKPAAQHAEKEQQSMLHHAWSTLTNLITQSK